MEQAIVGIGAILLGIIQIIVGVQTFKRFKKTATKSTSPFSAFGLWYGFGFGIIVILVGIATLTGNI